MADIETAMLARLRQVPAVTGIVGADAALRVYPLELPPRPVLPAATFLRISTSPQLPHSGGPLLKWARFQFNLWADTFAQMVALAAAVEIAFSGYRGTVDGVRIDQVRLLTEHDERDTEARKWRRVADYGVWYAQ